MPRLSSPSPAARPPRLLAVLVAALFAAGCGGHSTPAPAAPVIGPDGGTVTEPGGASVVVPPGAISGDTTIRIARDSTGAPALPAGIAASGDTYVITPHGGDFAAPVEVRIPVPAVALEPNQALKLAKAEPGGGWIVLDDTRLEDGVLTAAVNSFSFFVPVKVPYVLPVLALEPLRVTSSLACGGPGGRCDGMVGPTAATYTVTTNNGVLPANCTGGHLDIQHAESSLLPNLLGPGSTRAGVTREIFPPGGGSLTRTVLSAIGLYVFKTGLMCPGTNGSSGFAIQYGAVAQIRWTAEPTYPATFFLKAPLQVDVVEGQTATIEAVLSGGASRRLANGSYAAPSRGNMAVVEWQRSDDNGTSWNVAAVSYQDEANPDPGGPGASWRWWSVQHAFIATAADQGAQIRVRACYTPPDVPALPCEIAGFPSFTGHRTRINVLQQSALPVIVDAPRSVLVRVGQTASFSATAGGAPAPALQWQARAANSTGAWTDVTTGTGATTGNYTTAVLSLADTGTQYRVVATNAVGTAASAPVTASVSDLDVAPTITTQPSSLAVTAGSDAVFAVAARGTEALGYEWRKDGTPIAGANSPVLRLAAVTAASAGGYSVVVTNAAGTATSDVATLTVGPGLPAVVAPTIVTQPATVFVSAGNTATFAVGVSGSGPLGFQWRKDGVALPGATSAALTLAGVTSANAGVYSVVVSNPAGSVTSADASLELVTTPPPNPTAPVITTQPATLVVMPGAAATLAVAASGTGPLAYQWSRDGLPVPGATGPVLLLANVTSLEAGSYTVSITNVAGTATSATAQVILVGAPAITTQPASTAAVEGGTATFTVLASGPALRYQWLRNGALVDGATGSTFTTPPLALADSGAVFSVLVYTAAGLVNSQPAVLTVTAAPAVTLPTLASVRLDSAAAANNRSSNPSISADGRRVAFMSDGTDLVTGTTVPAHAYLRDLAAGTTTLVNARTDGGESARGVVDVKLAAGGRFAVFTSLANDLVAGDTNTAQDVFLRDLATGTTTRLNVLPDGSQDVVSGNAVGGQIDLSADGHLVLMSSGVNLAGDGALFPNGPRLFLRDTQANSTRTMFGVDDYGAATLSASGRFVVVVTPSPLGAPVVNHLLLHDVASNSTVSLLDLDASRFPDGIYGTPSISDDGRYIAFAVRSATLFGGAAATTPQIILLDRQAPPGFEFTVESRNAAGALGDGPSERPRLSADGRYLLFGTNAPNMSGDPAASLHHYVMLRDLRLHTTTVASRRPDGTIVQVNQANHVLSGDGAVLAFVAGMSSMFPPTPFGEAQVFVAPRPTAVAASALVVGSGNRQSGSISTPLAAQLAVIVTDGAGTPVSGFTVTWAATAGGAGVGVGAAGTATTTRTTDASGLATVDAFLGATGGPNTFTATAAGVGGAPASFTAFAADTLTVSGDAQSVSAPAGTALDPFVVTVTGGAGRTPIPNYPATWVVTAGGGQFTSAGGPTTIATTTDATGQASVVAFLGTRQTNTFQLTAPGFATVTVSAFNAIGVPP